MSGCVSRVLGMLCMLPLRSIINSRMESIDRDLRAAKTAGFSPLTKKSTPSFKSVLNSPYGLKWPELTHQQLLDTTEKITNALTGIRLPSAKTKADRIAAKERKKRKMTTVGKSSTDNETAVVEFNKEKRAQVVIGLNNVTRNLERDNLRASIVCLSAKPKALNRHLIMLTAVTRCPTIAMPNMSKTVSPILGVNTTLAIGFRKLVEDEVDYFVDLVGYISDTAPTISIPWLTTTVEPVSDKTTSGIEKQSKDQAAQEPTPCRPSTERKRLKRKRSCSATGVYVPLDVKTLIIKKKARTENLKIQK